MRLTLHVQHSRYSFFAQIGEGLPICAREVAEFPVKAACSEGASGAISAASRMPFKL
jgi:hypothetical protein